jgi:release factor glutamine methyltransferase
VSLRPRHSRTGGGEFDELPSGPPSSFAPVPPGGAVSRREPAGTPAAQALDGAITAISAAGCESPRLDAELLLAHALGVTRERLLSDRDLVVRGAAVRALQDAVRRRAVEREPVAYIVGRRAFRHIELEVDARALIPRPETELLVEVGCELSQGASVLDLGTGSGAVALALAHERPDLKISASDVSEPALALARANGARLDLHVRWLQSDLLRSVGDEFDAVLCNPPYVAEDERASLAPEILRHEPARALFAGRDGLDVVRSLAAQLRGRARLRTVALEVGAGQADAVAEMLRAAGFDDVSARSDLAGIERVVLAQRTRA